MKRMPGWELLAKAGALVVQTSLVLGGDNRRVGLEMVRGATWSGVLGEVGVMGETKLAAWVVARPVGETAKLETALSKLGVPLPLLGGVGPGIPLSAPILWVLPRRGESSGTLATRESLWKSSTMKMSPSEMERPALASNLVSYPIASREMGYKTQL